MRDYIQQEVQNRQAFSGAINVLFRFMKNIAVRKDLKTLLRLSDYQLRDVGLSRYELCRLLDMPMARDLSWELERSGTQDDARHLVQDSGADRALTEGAPSSSSVFTGRAAKA